MPPPLTQYHVAAEQQESDDSLGLIHSQDRQRVQDNFIANFEAIRKCDLLQSITQGQGVRDEDGEFNEVSFTLAPDEILLMHSDGFETAFPDPVDDRSRKAPSTRYLDYFRELRAAREEGNLQTAVAALARPLDEQAGSLHQIDDETALVVARRPDHAAVKAA